MKTVKCVMLVTLGVSWHTFSAHTRQVSGDGGGGEGVTTSHGEGKAGPVLLSTQERVAPLCTRCPPSPSRGLVTAMARRCDGAGGWRERERERQATCSFAEVANPRRAWSE
ncbi:hypothetical protein AAFF_G00325990 [Aldrovandia affinis]|uniref:Secreted protein n=1 Tax=Aldrovandia affinis TaxID=143900 RepID=A0AAD7TAT1_9TELE|nr:hypothetical protein AAFF_G00325990 [Aldrovandia affinis]